MRRREWVRDFQVETLNFRPTGRVCAADGCGGALHDNVLDWDSALPDDELDASIEAAEQAVSDMACECFVWGGNRGEGLRSE